LWLPEIVGPDPFTKHNLAMNRSHTYAILAAELERWGQKPLAELLAGVDAGPASLTVDIQGESVAFEILVRWLSPEHSALRITATASGPSNWRLERLEEGITIELSGLLVPESKMQT
jgi:hypothetical protein